MIAQSKITMLEQVIHTVFDFLFPSRCLGCNTQAPYACSTCVESAKNFDTSCLFCQAPSINGICYACTSTYSLDGIVWVFRYRTLLIERLIKTLKYSKRRRVAVTLSPYLYGALRELPTMHGVLVIPIPLHSKKEHERGFNQARELALGLKLPILAPRAFIRKKETPAQAKTQSRKERFLHMNEAFEVIDKTCIAGKTIVLIDDVATTGATLSAAARTLKHAGAVHVYAVVIAHG